MASTTARPMPAVGWRRRRAAGRAGPPEVSSVSRLDVLEEADVAGRVPGAGEEHRGLAELLDAVADEVHDVDPQRLAAVLVADRRSVEVRIGQAAEPRAHLGLVASPVLGNGLEGGVVLAAELGVGSPFLPV